MSHTLLYKRNIYLIIPVQPHRQSLYTTLTGDTGSYLHPSEYAQYEELIEGKTSHGQYWVLSLDFCLTNIMSPTMGVSQYNYAKML